LKDLQKQNKMKKVVKLILLIGGLYLIRQDPTTVNSFPLTELILFIINSRQGVMDVTKQDLPSDNSRSDDLMGSDLNFFIGIYNAITYRFADFFLSICLIEAESQKKDLRDDIDVFSFIFNGLYFSIKKLILSLLFNIDMDMDDYPQYVDPKAENHYVDRSAMDIIFFLVFGVSGEYLRDLLKEMQHGVFEDEIEEFKKKHFDITYYLVISKYRYIIWLILAFIFLTGFFFLSFFFISIPFRFWVCRRVFWR